MEMKNLTRTECIVINPQATTPNEVINLLAMRLKHAGRIQDVEAYIRCVMARESEGPTALGEELAVPHGKSPEVTEASFALAIFPREIAWPGLDGDEPVRLVFLLAIPPTEVGTTHIQLLTTLTSQLTDDTFRQALMAATTPEEVYSLLSGGSDMNVPEQAPVVYVKQRTNWVTPLVLGVISLAAVIKAALDWVG
ncbi:fructose PTS transporter subunit IIA [Scandinavium sp. H11S7]|uniref:fructose PTS transporter subunit IIA n=1 Tax=Scandinavium hiltneri TaxID=2926519 RepID=UPI002166479C|nr:fructose PTS transporter subunit IIA [Scandinavium hiltneri]MCS2157292.1 fructose PTS transporter subunit IIA [Scandinavium hiltneri]